MPKVQYPLIAISYLLRKYVQDHELPLSGIHLYPHAVQPCLKWQLRLFEANAPKPIQ